MYLKIVYLKIVSLAVFDLKLCQVVPLAVFDTLGRALVASPSQSGPLSPLHSEAVNLNIAIGS